MLCVHGKGSLSLCSQMFDVSQEVLPVCCCCRARLVCCGARPLHHRTRAVHHGARPLHHRAWSLHHGARPLHSQGVHLFFSHGALPGAPLATDCKQDPFQLLFHVGPKRGVALLLGLAGRTGSKVHMVGDMPLAGCFVIQLESCLTPFLQVILLMGEKRSQWGIPCTGSLS